MTPEQWSTLSEEERGSCEDWSGGVDGKGYGYVMVHGRQLIASRWTWEQEFGQIPTGMCVLHHCDRPLCVRLSHLFLGTQSDNMKDKVAKGRHRHGHENQTHCKHGHEFTPENTYLTQMGQYLVRVCRQCKLDRQRRTEVRQRANALARERRASSTRPCRDCSSPVPRQRGRQLCDVCRAESYSARYRRKKAVI
jgi:hypothetical protein